MIFFHFCKYGIFLLLVDILESSLLYFSHNMICFGMCNDLYSYLVSYTTPQLFKVGFLWIFFQINNIITISHYYIELFTSNKIKIDTTIMFTTLMCSFWYLLCHCGPLSWRFIAYLQKYVFRNNFTRKWLQVDSHFSWKIYLRH